MKTEVARLEETFDLVMLSDYFYESLVLLADQLCIDLKVLFVKERMESAPYEKTPLTDAEMRIFRDDF